MDAAWAALEASGGGGGGGGGGGEQINPMWISPPLQVNIPGGTFAPLHPAFKGVNPTVSRATQYAPFAGRLYTGTSCAAKGGLVVGSRDSVHCHGRPDHKVASLSTTTFSIFTASVGGRVQGY